MKKNDELEALRQQHDLLKKMLNQQEQVCMLSTVTLISVDKKREISE